jgi:hypothetical protein
MKTPETPKQVKQDEGLAARRKALYDQLVVALKPILDAYGAEVPLENQGIWELKVRTHVHPPPQMEECMPA